MAGGAINPGAGIYMPGNWPAAVRTNAQGRAWSPGWLGSDPDLYQPANWHSGRDIPVAGLRQIYILPLTAQFDAGAGNPAQAMHDFADGLQRQRGPGNSEPAWKEITDPLDHLNPPPQPARADVQDQIHRYGEFVYFYDFVQEALFCKPDGRKPERRIFHHRFLGAAHVTVNGAVFRPQVKRCNLYLLESGAAALVLELDFGDKPQVLGMFHSRAMMLADAQNFSSAARRSYTPFFDKDGPNGKPGGVPGFWQWLDGARQPLEKYLASQPADLATEFAHIHKARTAPMARHWQDLLHPLQIATRADQPGISWRPFADERIPLMSFVSLTGAAKEKNIAGVAVVDGQDADSLARQMDLSLVSRGDWARLCYADAAGNDPLPYAPAILRDFEEKACYDRYFPGDATDTAVRFTFAGYHFAAVGAGWYFDNEIAQHFRRHYFQIGLVVTMELASMLALSGRVTEAVRRSRGQPGHDGVQKFRQDMLDIQRAFLELTHLYVFRGLSNQLQPTEMYDKWRKALNLDAIFDDLKNEIDSAANFIAAARQSEQSDAANRLATIAAIGVVLGLWLAACSVIFAAQGSFRGSLAWIIPGSPNIFSPRAAAMIVAGVLLLTALSGLGLLWAARRFSTDGRESDGWSGSRHERLLRFTLIGVAVVALVVCVVRMLPLVRHFLAGQ